MSKEERTKNKEQRERNMLVHGCDCSIVIKTSECEMDVPYSDETLREAVSLLEEEAAIEGDGTCRAIRKYSGSTGCVITPLTIGTTPLLFYLAMGSAGNPVYVSETKNLYKYELNLLPLEDTDHFDLIQDRQSQMRNEQLAMSNERRLFERCRVKGFELRVMRGEAIKLKLDICGERYPTVFLYKDRIDERKERDTGRERFNGDFATYKINDKEYKNIYGVTLSSNKENGTRTELWIKRALNKGSEIPHLIDKMTISAQLLRTRYEDRHFGKFRITLKKLILTSDETNVNSNDTVIGSLRYYVTDTVATEIYNSGEKVIA